VRLGGEPSVEEAAMWALVYHGPGKKDHVFGDAASGALKVVLTREEEGGAR
jgi:hypothetical protein